MTGKALGSAIFLLLLAALRVGGGAAAAASDAVTRADFPAGFVFGVGSSAYQIEGAAAEDGRKPSIWDTFTHQGYSSGNATGDVTADQYHKYKEDVKLLHAMGVDAYRFSIAWPRLIPDGHGAINLKGLEYYNNLIDELLIYGIQPHVTMYHCDFPQALQDDYKGLLSPRFMPLPGDSLLRGTWWNDLQREAILLGISLRVLLPVNQHWSNLRVHLRRHIANLLRVRVDCCNGFHQGFTILGSKFFN